MRRALRLLVVGAFSLPALAALVLLMVRPPDMDWWLVWSLYGATAIALALAIDLEEREQRWLLRPGDHDAEAAWRMAFLGDSCTEQGCGDAVPPRLASSRPDGPRFEAVNLGVAGYSSYQGRIVARRMLGKLEPDLGVVCYGWNDHWLAYGAPDSKKATERDQVPSWLRAAIASSRLLQWIAKLRAGGHDVPLDVTVCPEKSTAPICSISAV